MYADAPAYVIWLDLVRDSQNEMKFMWLLERGRGDRCKKFNNEWEFLAKSFQIAPHLCMCGHIFQKLHTYAC